MKGVKYNLRFIKPDQTIITINNLTSAELQQKIPELFNTHYGYVFNCNISVINSLNTRVHKINRFVRDKVSIIRTDKMPAQPINNTTQTTMTMTPTTATIANNNNSEQNIS